MSVTRISVGLGVVLVAGTAFAQQQQPQQQGQRPTPQKPTFESLDRDGDGQISIQEATVNDDVFVAFKMLDTNRDGALSREEYAAYEKD